MSLVWRAVGGVIVGLIVANLDAYAMVTRSLLDDAKLVLQVLGLGLAQAVLFVTFIMVVVVIGLAPQLSLFEILMGGFFSAQRLAQPLLMAVILGELGVVLAKVVLPLIGGMFLGLALRRVLPREVPQEMTEDLRAVRAALARSSWPVVLSGIYALVSVLGVLVVFDLVSSLFTEQPSRVPSVVRLSPVLILIAFNEMLLSLVEFVTRHRNPRNNFTLWIIVLPLGRTLRAAIMLVLMLPLALIKLLTYFVFLMVVDPLSGIFRRLGLSRGAIRLDFWLLLLGFAFALIGLAASIVLGLVLGGQPAAGLAPPPPAWLMPALLTAVGITVSSVVLLSLDIDRSDEFTERPEQALSWLFNLLYLGKIEPGGGVFSVLFNANLMLWNLNH